MENFIKKYQIRTYYTSGANRGYRKSIFYADTIEEARNIWAENGTGERFNLLNPTIFEWRKSDISEEYGYFYKEG